jgi:hypothetical protein
MREDSFLRDAGEGRRDMAYLSGQAENTFENTMKYWKGRQSMQLKATILAVKKYLSLPQCDLIRDVAFCWEAWKLQQPGEFKTKGEIIKAAFEKEIAQKYQAHGIVPEGDSAPQPAALIPFAPKVAINRWRGAKYAAKAGMAAANVGITAAQYGTGSAGLATIAEGAIAGTAVAVSATGIGLIVGGLALTVAGSVLSATAAWKSANHRDNLIEIYQKRSRAPFSEEKFCQLVPAGRMMKTREVYAGHDMVANHVLPYIIYQKDRKFKRRAFGAVPVLGSLESVRGALNYAYKKYVTGTQGALRHHAAAWLAQHLITCDCLLAQAITAELYSVGEMEWLKGESYTTVTGYLESKMTST